MPTPTPAPKPDPNQQGVLGAINLRPDSALNVSMSPGKPGNAANPSQQGPQQSSQLGQGQRPGPLPRPSTHWINAPIESVDPLDMIRAARYEASKIVTNSGEPYKTEAQVLAEIKGQEHELERQGAFPRRMWWVTRGTIAGFVASAGTLAPTVLLAGLSLKGGASVVGSPTLACSAVISGVVAGVSLVGTHFAHKFMRDRFHQSITRCLTQAMSSPRACDKLEWTATFIGNIDRMNPVVLRPGSTSLTADSADKYKLSYWVDIARNAAGHLYRNRPTGNQSELFEDLNEVAASQRFNRQINPPSGNPNSGGMYTFLSALESRWFGVADWVKKVADWVGVASALSTLICTPTIVAHGVSTAYFGNYLEFVAKTGTLARQLLGL